MTAQELQDLKQAFRTVIYGNCLEKGEDLMPCDVQDEIDNLFAKYPSMRSVMNFRGLARKKFVVEIMQSCGWFCELSLV